LKNKKTSLLNLLIDFFASLYDLVIDFFASLYDVVYNAISFLGEYVKWVTTLRPAKSADFNTPAKETIPVHNQNPFEVIGR